MKSTPIELKNPIGWVWHSTEKSIAQGQISISAVLEIFLAMALYGALAYYSPWPWFSLLACLAAPMLLLRSEASVRRGKVMLWRYWRRKRISEVNKLIINFIAGLFTYLIFYVLVRPRSQGHDGWTMHWSDLIYGLFLGIYFRAFTVAGSITGHSFTDSTEVVRARQRLLNFERVIYTPAFVIGIYARATAIRVFTTLRYLSQGLPAFAGNWRETVLVVDVWHPPSLLPEAERVLGVFNVKRLLKRPCNDFADWIEKNSFLLMIYLPALIYRWNIKASALIWGFVAFALRPATWANDEDMRLSMSWRTTYPFLGLMFPAVLSFLLWLLAPWLPDGLSTELPAFMAKLLELLPSPALNLRTSLLTLTLLSWLLLLLFAYRLRAAHEVPLGDSDNLENSKNVTKASFRRLAKPVRTSGQWTAALMFFTVWTYALAWSVNRWPDPVERLVWDWVKPWL